MRLLRTLDNSCLSIDVQSKSNCSIGLTVVVMGSDLEGLAGRQLFRTSDAPNSESASCKYPVALRCWHTAHYVYPGGLLAGEQKGGGALASNCYIEPCALPLLINIRSSLPTMLKSTYSNCV
jgi:hypothetical protein